MSIPDDAFGQIPDKCLDDRMELLFSWNANKLVGELVLSLKLPGYLLNTVCNLCHYFDIWSFFLIISDHRTAPNKINQPIIITHPVGLHIVPPISILLGATKAGSFCCNLLLNLQKKKKK